MDVVIAGGHGKVALLLAQLLTERGDRVRSYVRDPAQDDDVRAVGAEPLRVDLEADDTYPVDGADAVVFAAGSGPGSGAARKRTVDRDAALRLARSCEAQGVRRYVLVSSMGVTATPDSGDEAFDAYLLAKHEAEQGLLASDLAVTIIRPGRLTDAAGTDRVLLAPSVDHGAVPRADVAAVLAHVVAMPSTFAPVAELVSGPTPIADAVRGLTS